MRAICISEVILASRLRRKLVLFIIHDVIHSLSSIESREKRKRCLARLMQTHVVYRRLYIRKISLLLHVDCSPLSTTSIPFPGLCAAQHPPLQRAPECNRMCGPCTCDSASDSGLSNALAWGWLEVCISACSVCRQFPLSVEERTAPSLVCRGPCPES